MAISPRVSLPPVGCPQTEPESLMFGKQPSPCPSILVESSSSLSEATPYILGTKSSDLRLDLPPSNRFLMAFKLSAKIISN